LKTKKLASGFLCELCDSAVRRHFFITLLGASMRQRVVVVGSINLDLVCSVERIPRAGETLSGNRFEMFHGGKAADQAVALMPALD
jgi:hypothetical protein